MAAEPGAALAGRTVLVAGGSGQVGDAIVGHLLAAGARVVVPTRSDPSTILDRHGGAPDLHVVAGSLATAADAEALRDRIVADGLGVTDAVASIGGWWSGPPVGGLRPGDWDDVRAALDAHVHTANAFLPLLAANGPGSYTFVNGGGALEPVPGSGLVTVSAAAQLMLARVVAAEQAGAPIAVHSLVAMTPLISRDRPNGPSGWLRVDDVARAVVLLASDVDAARRHPTIVTLGSTADVDALG